MHIEISRRIDTFSVLPTPSPGTFDIKSVSDLSRNEVGLVRVPISILMATYWADDATALQQSLASLDRQSVVPLELILVVDGPIPPSSKAVIEARAQSGPFEMVVLALEKNVGLAAALNAGLAVCRGDFVARMDADDLARADRLEKQWAVLQADASLDVVSSWHAEFEVDPDRPFAMKTVPRDHESILAALRWRCIISHPTVVARSSLLMDVGGYRRIEYLEDYDLYMRLAERGARFCAVQEPLVFVRVTLAQRARRGGLRYVRTEWRFRLGLYRRGSLTFVQFILSTIAYTVLRILPVRARAALYAAVRRPIRS
jgi:glycosyltransferase involved in cell wall biosynthesis